MVSSAFITLQSGAYESSLVIDTGEKSLAEFSTDSSLERYRLHKSPKAFMSPQNYQVDQLICSLSSWYLFTPNDKDILKMIGRSITSAQGCRLGSCAEGHPH